MAQVDRRLTKKPFCLLNGDAFAQGLVEENGALERQWEGNMAGDTGSSVMKCLLFDNLEVKEIRLYTLLSRIEKR